LNLESIGSYGTSIGGGFFVGLLVGFALKKILKILAIIVGLFFAGLTYLQYQQILNINWSKLQMVSQNTVSMLTDATTRLSNHVSNFTDSNNHSNVTLPISSLGIPLTGSIAMGFGIGFMEG
jgi:uncharacterized membrane protein (Fun14 family)